MADEINIWENPFLIARFWAKVEIPRYGGCWIWTAGMTRGYGVFKYRGRMEGAHRLAWSIFNRADFPDGLHGMHTCDNPSCVNPEHVVPATQAENNRDMFRKNRCVSANARKTHCHAGHPLSGENLFIAISGKRACKACRTISVRAHRERERIKRAA
jgi:hypothetical protein